MVNLIFIIFLDITSMIVITKVNFINQIKQKCISLSSHYLFSPPLRQGHLYILCGKIL